MPWPGHGKIGITEKRPIFLWYMPKSERFHEYFTSSFNTSSEMGRLRKNDACITCIFHELSIFNIYHYSMRCIFYDSRHIFQLPTTKMVSNKEGAKAFGQLKPQWDFKSLLPGRPIMMRLRWLIYFLLEQQFHFDRFHIMATHFFKGAIQARKLIALWALYIFNRHFFGHRHLREPPSLLEPSFKVGRQQVDSC